MKEFTITQNDAGQRLDRWLGKTLPLLPAPLAQKYIRLKRVKVNGKGSQRDVRLQVGDLLQLYINDEFFAAAPSPAPARRLPPGARPRQWQRPCGAGRRGPAARRSARAQACAERGRSGKTCWWMTCENLPSGDRKSSYRRLARALRPGPA